MKTKKQKLTEKKIILDWLLFITKIISTFVL